MDFLIYICLIIVIALFFFMSNFSEGKNTMLTVFILSIFGLVMLLNSAPEVIVGTNTTILKDSAGFITGATSEFITEPLIVFGLGTTNFFALIFIAFLLLSVTTIYFSDEEMNIRK